MERKLILNYCLICHYEYVFNLCVNELFRCIQSLCLAKVLKGKVNKCISPKVNYANCLYFNVVQCKVINLKQTQPHFQYVPWPSTI